MHTTAEQLSALRRYDTCTLANAIEHFHVRLRNEGYTGTGVKCLFADFTPIAGFAITARVKSSNPPIEGSAYLDRTDWWSAVSKVAQPCFAAIQDVDEHPGVGAVAGEIHSAILTKLGCVGLVTNGSVRDVPALRKAGFPVFAGGVSPSHAYIHIVDFGVPVVIGGLSISTGDLLIGDCHGVLSIPPGLVPELPAMAERLLAKERRIIDLCQSAGFSLEALEKEVKS